MARSRIAIIGSGIAGLTAWYRLRERHDCVLIEAAPRLGGHTRTVSVTHEGRSQRVDTGFIVCNPLTYPKLFALFRELQVELRPTTMSLSVRDEAGGEEWQGSIVGAFAQLRRLCQPSWWAMLREVGRFHAACEALAGEGAAWRPEGLRLAGDADRGQTLGELLDQAQIGALARRLYVIPICSAIWSCPPSGVLDQPAAAIAAFLANHRMTRMAGRPQWYTVIGGAQTYIDRLVAGHEGEIRCACPLVGLHRQADGVVLRFADRPSERYDHVVLACHSNQALALLDDATPDEREILGAIPYQPNRAQLHHDRRQLPRARRAWSAWNYHAGDRQAALTYDMEILQGLGNRQHLLVSLNRTTVDQTTVLDTHIFDHPVFTTAGLAAQRRWAEISGVDRVHFCGAYWGAGFHEDGCASGERVAAAINAIESTTAISSRALPECVPEELIASNQGGPAPTTHGLSLSGSGPPFCSCFKGLHPLDPVTRPPTFRFLSQLLAAE